ncbi:MAG: hypothetical protein KGO94_03145 [Alphaproteobacteria bacterium]|nr:hypothetical protein [Alphaproteobacteria bacterium]
MRFVVIVISTVAFVSGAQAVSLAQVIRDCGSDSKTFCKGVGYGKPMQSCLSGHKTNLKPACRAIVARLEKGEPVRLLGW